MAGVLRVRLCGCDEKVRFRCSFVTGFRAGAGVC